MVDYTLANQSGAQFRAELNLILAALQACAYGATAPTTTTAGQIWVDASGASPVLKVRNALNSGWIALGALASDGFQLAGTSEPGRALIAAATVAAQRTALGLGASAIAGLATQAQAQAGADNTTVMTPLRVAQAIAALVAAATNLQASDMAPTIAASTVVLKHCSGGGSDVLSLSKNGTGTIYETFLGETALTATRDCALRVALEQRLVGDTTNAQRAAVLRDGVVLQEWTTTSTGWIARSLDVTLTAGQTLYLRLGATGRTSGGSDGTVFTSESHIRYVRYLADQRSLIGI